MFWVPLIMGAAALSGAVMSANGKKYIDPNWIEEHTGSHAFAQEFNNMFNQLQSTPQGQEMINSAMSQGQQVANTIRQNATNAGFGGAEGVQSGGSLFATSVADSAPSSLRRMATAAIGQQAQANVSEILQRRLNAYLAERQQPSKQEVIGNLLQQGGMLGLQASLNAPPGKTAAEKTLATAGAAAASEGATQAATNQLKQVPVQNPTISIPQQEPDVAPIPYEMTGEDLVAADQLPRAANPYASQNPNQLWEPQYDALRTGQRMPKAPPTEMQRMGYGGRLGQIGTVGADNDLSGRAYLPPREPGKVPFMFNKYNPGISSFTGVRNAAASKPWRNIGHRTRLMTNLMQSPEYQTFQRYVRGM